MCEFVVLETLNLYFLYYIHISLIFRVLHHVICLHLADIFYPKRLTIVGELLVLLVIYTSRFLLALMSRLTGRKQMLS